MFPVVSLSGFEIVRSVLYEEWVDSTNSRDSLFIDLLCIKARVLDFDSKCPADSIGSWQMDRQTVIWNVTPLCRSPGFNDSCVVWGVKLSPLCSWRGVTGYSFGTDRRGECWPYHQLFVVCFTGERVIYSFSSHLVNVFQKQNDCKMRFLRDVGEEMIPS